MIGQHPEVATARRKEVHYFNKEGNYRQGLPWYQSQFVVPATASAVGEFTPNYFWTTDDDLEIEESGLCRNIPEKVFDALPDVKLVLCLRNPVDRAVSAYYHLMKHGYFRSRQGLSEVWNNRGILTMGYYDIHLARWLEYFPMERFLVLIYEEDLPDQQKVATLERIFRHIGVSDSFVPADLHSRINPRLSHFELRIRSLPPRVSTICRRLIPEHLKQSPAWEIPVAEHEAEQLKIVYAPHINRLEYMLGRTLPWE